MLKITRNLNVKESERKHQLGDIVTDIDRQEQYLVIEYANGLFGLLVLSTMQMDLNEYETLEEMWEDNKDDVFLNAELIIND